MPFSLPSIGGGLLWKLGTGLATLGIIVLTFFLVLEQRETARLNEQVAELNTSINDPQTGYVARLAQSQTNVVQLRTAIERQMVVFREREAENARVLESTRQQLRAANERNADLQRRAQRILTTPIEGDTLEERVRDVDNMIMEDLNRVSP